MSCEIRTYVTYYDGENWVRTDGNPVVYDSSNPYKIYYAERLKYEHVETEPVVVEWQGDQKKVIKKLFNVWSIVVECSENQLQGIYEMLECDVCSFFDEKNQEYKVDTSKDEYFKIASIERKDRTDYRRVTIEFYEYNSSILLQKGKRTDNPITLNLQNSLKGKAYHLGTADLSSGFAWDDEIITIKVDGGTTKTVTLSATTTTAAEVVAEITTQLASATPSAVTGIEIYTYMGYIGIRRTVPGTSYSFEIVGGTALTFLGWTDAVYTGTYTIDEDFETLSTAGVLSFQTDFSLTKNITDADKTISKITGKELTNQVINKKIVGLLFVMSETDKNNLKEYLPKCDAITVVDTVPVTYTQADTSIEYEEQQIAYNNFIVIISVPYEVNVFFPNN